MKVKTRQRRTLATLIAVLCLLRQQRAQGFSHRYLPIKQSFEALSQRHRSQHQRGREKVAFPKRSIGRNNNSNNNNNLTVLKMCQLLAMNCASPTDFSFSFLGFSRRGGDTDIHSDGWGMAWYEGKGLRVFHDVLACSDSPLARMLHRQRQIPGIIINNNNNNNNNNNKINGDNSLNNNINGYSSLDSYPVKTLNMMAHIRYATQGEVSLENVHPFSRELWGINWCFCHNGDVPMFSPPSNIVVKQDDNGDDGGVVVLPPWIGDVPIEQQERTYNPVGATDSEAIFCAILNALKAKFDSLPSLPVLYDEVQSLCQEIVDYDPDSTILNFLFGCGEHVQFAYSWPGSRPGSDVWNGLHYIVREPPFSTAHLSDCDYTLDFSEFTTDEDRVAVIATKPLTDDEEWIEVERGQLILFDEGLPHMRAIDCFNVELKKHGLESGVIPQAKVVEDMRRYQFKPSFFEGEGI